MKKFLLISIIPIFLFAHKINLFLDYENGNLFINSYFANAKGCINCKFEIKDKDGNLINLPSASLKQYWEIRKLPFGSARRQAIVQLLETGYLIPVNGIGCIQLNVDKDLQKLLKEEKIEMYNERSSGHFKRTIVRYKHGSERRKRKRN